MSDQTVSVERVLPTSPEAIFAFLTDASRHPEIDGSGTVIDNRGAPPERLELGSEFGMNMKYVVPYAMKSRVIEYETNRRIAWQTVPAYRGTEWLAGGRIWRYELEPVEGGTLVRETWDISKEKPLFKPLVAAQKDKTRENIARSLERLEQVLS